jgi:hypothetical protein
MLSDYPILQSVPSLGLITGIIHHFLIQYPRQASIFRTIYAYVTGNLVFVAFTRLQPDKATRLSGVLLRITLFNFVYVCPCYFKLLNPKISTALLLKVMYNVAFRHRGIPTKFWWAATDFRYSNSFGTGQSHKEIEALHKTLGSLVLLNR